MVALLGAITACSTENSPGATPLSPGSPPPSATAKATTYPLTIDNCGRKVTFEMAPSRVLLLNGASVGEVESFITLGIQDRIVANSQSYGVSDDPSMVDKVKAVPTNSVRAPFFLILLRGRSRALR
jgi:iron complex transport system substrate-binding protein